MIGKKISPILEEIEDTLWEFEYSNQGRPQYSKGGMRSSIKIFMSVIMDKMWELQEGENMDMETRCAMSQKCGEEVRELVKKYTGVDTHSLYV